MIFHPAPSTRWMKIRGFTNSKSNTNSRGYRSWICFQKRIKRMMSLASCPCVGWHWNSEMRPPRQFWTPEPLPTCIRDLCDQSRAFLPILLTSKARPAVISSGFGLPVIILKQYSSDAGAARVVIARKPNFHIGISCQVNTIAANAQEDLLSQSSVSGRQKRSPPAWDTLFRRKVQDQSGCLEPGLLLDISCSSREFDTRDAPQAWAY
jgi:hypothetical protein